MQIAVHTLGPCAHDACAINHTRSSHQALPALLWRSSTSSSLKAALVSQRLPLMQLSACAARATWLGKQSVCTE